MSVIILGTYSIFFQGHALMHVFSLWLTRRSYRLHYLFFACQRDPSRGQSVRRVLLPFVSCQDWNGWLSAYFIYFYKVYFITLDICFHWILCHVRYGHFLKGSALILRVLFYFDVSDIFGGVSEVVS